MNSASVWVARASALTLLVVVSIGLTACGALTGGGDMVSVSDPDNLFHIKVPEQWQSSTDGGFISIYADKQLPAAGEQPSALSFLVFSTREESETPVPEMLDYLIDARASARGWTDVEKSEFTETTVGGVPAQYVNVVAKGEDGKQFDSRYFFVRVGGVEAFAAAIAPPGKGIEDYEDELEDLTTEWYWHFSTDQSGADSQDTSGTP